MHVSRYSSSVAFIVREWAIPLASHAAAVDNTLVRLREPQLAAPTLTVALAMMICLGTAPKTAQAVTCPAGGPSHRAQAIEREQLLSAVAFSAETIDAAARRQHRLASTHTFIEPWQTARASLPMPSVRLLGLLQPPPRPAPAPPMHQLLNLPPPRID